ncbi:hypothetical protein PBI_RYAN_50 [Arthrobacter phage Ryan]|uniref:Uncharacterized protein n=1 Tax=Arthrobacter phage Ryan TaxID=2419968 RepID=A0A3G2KJG9_9CAUD|nr:hypothetical protein QEO75_gp59 [Arthrobacter phage Ryan]AYN59040.1 hypothetical protein PBI_RYAN_50 [Arthrobacter phage Ryan]
MPNRNHGLARNADNESICLCGFRPEILDSVAPVGRDWKAKTIILNHAAALNNDIPEAPRSPDSPFTGNPDAKYPRAGVRPTTDGKWRLTLWDAPDVQHELDEPDFGQLSNAFDYGWLRIGACRDSGTDLNGRAVA